MKARYIIETEEWKVQPVADDASAETILANGMSAVKTGDLATAEKMAALLAAKAQAAPGGRGRRGARRARPGTGSDRDGVAGRRQGRTVMHRELAASSPRRRARRIRPSRC